MNRPAKTICLALIGLSVVVTGAVWFWPHDAGYYFNRGMNRLTYEDEDGNGGDIDGALADFNRVIRLDPNYAAAYRGRAAAREIKSDLKGALADYDKAIELDPKDTRNFIARAESRKDHDDLTGALADYDRAIEANPKDPTLYPRRAHLRWTMGDFKGMVADQASESEVMPPLPLNQLSRAGGLFRDQNLARLVGGLQRLYDRAIDQDPNYSWGYFHRGVLESFENDPTGALADFQQCFGFNDLPLKDLAAIHTWLVHVQQGERPAADAALSTYLNTRTNGTPGDWEVQIAKFFLNQTSEADLSAAIGPSGAERQRSQFWYYAGMKYLLAGDKAKATDYLLKSRTTETRPYAVAISSQIELIQLNQ